MDQVNSNWYVSNLDFFTEDCKWIALAPRCRFRLGVPITDGMVLSLDHNWNNQADWTDTNGQWNQGNQSNQDEQGGWADANGQWHFKQKPDADTYNVGNPRYSCKRCCRCQLCDPRSSPLPSRLEQLGQQRRLRE